MGPAARQAFCREQRAQQGEDAGEERDGGSGTRTRREGVLRSAGRGHKPGPPTTHSPTLEACWVGDGSLRGPPWPPTGWLRTGCLEGGVGSEGWEGEASQVEGPRWGGGVCTAARYKEAGGASAQPIGSHILEAPGGVEGALEGESGQFPRSLGSAPGLCPASLSLWTLWVCPCLEPGGQEAGRVHPGNTQDHTPPTSRSLQREAPNWLEGDFESFRPWTPRDWASPWFQGAPWPR